MVGLSVLVGPSSLVPLTTLVEVSKLAEVVILDTSIVAVPFATAVGVTTLAELIVPFEAPVGLSSVVPFSTLVGVVTLVPFSAAVGVAVLDEFVVLLPFKKGGGFTQLVSLASRLDELGGAGGYQDNWVYCDLVLFSAEIVNVRLGLKKS